MIYRNFIIENSGLNSFSKRYAYYLEREPITKPTQYAFDLMAAQQGIDEHHYNEDPCIANLRWFEYDGETLQVNDTEVDGETLYIYSTGNAKYATSIQGYHEPSGQFNNIDFDEIEKL